MPEREQEPLQFRCITGRAPQPTFAVERSPQPRSVGTGGDSIVDAEGVGPVHLYVVYDGTDVFVSPVPGHTVLLAGVPVAAGWTKVPVPSELRFAGAVIGLDRAWPTLVMPERSTTASMHGVSTLSDGGALREAALRAVPGQTRPSSIPPQAITGLDTPIAVPLGGHRIVTEVAPASSFGSTVVMVPRSMTPSPPRASVPPASLPPGDGTMAALTGMPGVMPGFPSTLKPAGTPPEGESPTHPSMPPTPRFLAEPPAPVPPLAPQSLWQRTSAVSKISVVLFMLVIGLVAFSAARKRAAARASLAATAAPSVASTAVAPSASSTVALAPTTVVDEVKPAAPSAYAVAPPPYVRPQLPATPTPPSRQAGAVTKPATRTPERVALDTVAAGSFADAADDYTSLASAHADDVRFKEAARILHEKAARGH